MKTKLFFIVSIITIGFLTAQETEIWQNRAPIPSDARHHSITFSIGNTGYLLGGTTGDGPSQSGDIINFANKDFYSYNPDLDEWTSLGDYPGPSRSFSYADVYDDKSYVGFGIGNTGFYLNDLWVFDPELNQWTELASCPCQARRHPAFIAHRGKIFVGMGDGVFGNLNDWWEYDIETNTWRALANLPGLVRHHPYHFKAGDDVYVGMGHGVGIFDDWYKWNIDEEEWTQMNDFPDQARVAGTEFSFENYGYVLSGDGSNHGTMNEGEFWKYDHQEDTWEELPPHNGISRWAPGSFVINNRAYFIGGYVRNGVDIGYRKDMMMFILKEDDEIEEPNSISQNGALSHTNFLIYPNPAKNLIYIEEKYINENEYAEIYNISGKLVKKVILLKNGIDISNFSSGVYSLVLKNNMNNEIIESRFIKE